MKLKSFAHTLRFKLVASSILIQIVFIALLISNSLSLVEDGLIRQTEVRIAELERLLNSSLAAPFVQQDYEVIQEILNDSVENDGILWLSIHDTDNEVIVESGARVSYEDGQSSNLAESIRNDNAVYHSTIPIKIAGVEYGKLHYDISLNPVISTKTGLLDISLLISIVGIIITALTLLVTGMWLTRNLSILAKASESLSQGNLRTRIEVNSNDEVKYLASAFNSMADTLEKRIQDLHESQETQENLLAASQQEKARLTSLLSVMTRGILFETLDATIAYYNPAFSNMFHFDTLEKLNGLAVNNLSKAIVPKLKDKFQKKYLLNTSANQSEVELLLSNNQVLIQKHYPVYDDNQNILGTLWMFEDVTALRKTADQLIHLAEHDALTGLFNRRKFQEEFQHNLDLCKRHDNELALVFFDIDDFKFVNDGFGHQFGDELLVNVANEVSKLIRKEEYFYRLGGDEFAILLPDANKRDACILASRIVHTISSIPLYHHEKRMHITSSIGISLFPLHAHDKEELLSCADIAMYQAKKAGKNTYKVYERDLESSVVMQNRINWDNIINEALSNNTIILNYQGVYDIQSDMLLYLEALARLRSADNETYTLPGQFIPFAEQSGKILEIDRRILNEAIERLSASPEVPCIGVNISGRSFDDPALEAYIVNTLNEFNVEPQRLLLELTETAAVSDLHYAQRFIQVMRAHGCKVALDDFGSGYSSFVYLKHLHTDYVKIDGMFTQDLASNKDSQLFVKAIVDIAHGLEKAVIAEFVENEESLSILKKMGVDYAQGYFLDTPSAKINMDTAVAV